MFFNSKILTAARTLMKFKEELDPELTMTCATGVGYEKEPTKAASSQNTTGSTEASPGHRFAANILAFSISIAGLMLL